MKFLKIIAILGGVFVALALLLDSAIGYFQPEGGDRTATLRTFDEAGQPYDRVLLLLNDDGQLWVESGHWFRGWYRQALANPRVALVQDGQETPYDAVPVNAPETVDKITRLMGKGSDNRYWIGRAICLFAPIKPLRLDPVSSQPDRDGDQQAPTPIQQAPMDTEQDSTDASLDPTSAEQDPVSVQQDPVSVTEGPASTEQSSETPG